MSLTTLTDGTRLSSRHLNNGEPLSRAKKRNAMGGDMCKLIREIAKHQFFQEFTSFPTKRYQHYETVAKFILMEHNVLSSSGEIYCILKKGFLDDMVQQNKSMKQPELSKLKKTVVKNLNVMTRIFRKNDPLLKRLNMPQLYYVFCRETYLKYGHELLYSRIRDFLDKFQKQRIENLQIPDKHSRDWLLTAFNRLMLQNNDEVSMYKRVQILTILFLDNYADIEKKAKRRLFTKEEKSVILDKSGGKCTKCNREITIEEMDADHIKAFAHGGPTTMANAQALCINCNRNSFVTVN